MRNNKYKAFDNQLMQAIDSARTARHTLEKYHDGDWLDSLQYGLLFGTPDELFRQQVRAKTEAEKDGRAFTPVFWTATEAGAEPVMTLWRIK